MNNFRSWCAPFISSNGKWGVTYNQLTQEQKDFYKEAKALYDGNPSKFSDIEDYWNYTQHPLKYKLSHLLKGGK